MIGICFFCANMSLFLGLIVAAEILRRVRALISDAMASVFKHDTDVFPDHFENPVPAFPRP